MNKDQRKYLSDQVSKTLRGQLDELEQQRPRQPSLNNFLIASIMDNTVKFADLLPLKEKIHDRVLKMGKEDALIEEDDDDGNWYSGRRKRKDTKNTYVKLLAEDIFVIPKAYTDALKEFQEKNGEIDKKIKELTAQANTIEMKIQIGSSESLSKLVTEVDNLTDLSLMNSKFLLNG